MKRTRTIHLEVEPLQLGDDTVADVIQQLNQRMDPLFDDGGFSLHPPVSEDREARGAIPWHVARSEFRFLAIFFVEGGSEGHWVHIAFVMHKGDRGVDNTHRTVATCKTFLGFDHAQEIANTAQFLLDDA